MSIKVSVVVPMYNVEKYLEACLDSIVNQTLKEIEIILVDDGSPDSSGKIADSYAEKDPRIRVIHKQNGGVSEARNDGISQSHGEYLYIMDSDDCIAPEALKKMYNQAMKSSADVVISDHYMCDENLNHPRPAHFFPEEFVTDDIQIIHKLRNMAIFEGYSPFESKEYKGLGIGAPWTKLIKRSLVTEHNLKFDSYVKGVFDDGLFCVEVFQKAKKVSYIRENLYYYRVLKTSLMRGFNPKREEINDRIFERIRNFGENYSCMSEIEGPYWGRVFLNLRFLFIAYFCNANNKASKKERYKEMKKVISKKVYSDMIKKVDISKLNSSGKKMIILLRLHLYIVVFNHFERKGEK